MSCMIYFLFNNYEVFRFMFFDMIIIYVGFGLSYAIKYLGFDTTQTVNTNCHPYLSIYNIYVNSLN